METLHFSVGLSWLTAVAYSIIGTLKLEQLKYIILFISFDT